jgi:DMSO/TMAO reductase YedYZ molybdopterin-dependent catalytic subunit
MLRKLGSYLIVMCLFLGLFLAACSKPQVTSTNSVGEVEALEFQGQQLTPMKNQRNNALRGTQHIDKASYVLTVDGLVNKPLSLSYADLQALPQNSVLILLIA